MAGASPSYTTLPKVRSLESLKRLLPLLRCPVSKSSLSLCEEDHNIVISEHGINWDCHDFVPIFFNRGSFESYPVGHISNALAEKAVQMIESTNGLVLNLSAGGSDKCWPHVIEVEAGIFRNTDVIGDSQNLPFHDNVFDVCIAMNAFEHYNKPHLAALEILRVLKPGGIVLIHTAFLQPIHEPPFHFFNATKFGVAEWFRDFDIKSVSTSDNFNPIYSISWILSDLIGGLVSVGHNEDAEYLGTLTLNEMIEIWRGRNLPERAQKIFQTLPVALVDNLAAGVELIGSKRQ